MNTRVHPGYRHAGYAHGDYEHYGRAGGPGHRTSPAAGGAVVAVARLVAAPVVGAMLGVGLGAWCRAEAERYSVMGVLADLGAPWIAAAFAAGVVAMVLFPSTTRSTAGHFAAALAGATAGASALVVATVVYYGPARTGGLTFDGALAATAVWSAIGIGVGTVFGAAGALWRSAPAVGGRVACLVIVGTAITAEAFFLLDTAASDALVRRVLVVVAVAGAAIPVLAGLRWQALVGVGAVAMLALPASLVAEALSKAAYYSIAVL
ncbi:MAG: hypothetical protein ACRD0G_05160 [Acidimicrobiales bacterium]